MAINDRLGRLEKRTGLDKPAPCPECGGRVLFVEHHLDGTVTYPFEEPCQACHNKRGDGRIGRIEIVPIPPPSEADTTPAPLQVVE